MSTYDDRRRQKEADAAYARRLQAEEYDQRRDQTPLARGRSRR